MAAIHAADFNMKNTKFRKFPTLFNMSFQQIYNKLSDFHDSVL